jgi:glyoxylase-like metal-dependent hydrolase (beta-lactamase superfamily II)
MVNHIVKDHETFSIGGIKVTGMACAGAVMLGLHTPCHTQDSVCFFLEQDSSKAVFTGDTLFIGGCGKFFEVGPTVAN